MIDSDAAVPANASVTPFGTLPDGRSVQAITLTSVAGICVTVLTYGATLQSVLLPGRDGVIADVVLGHAALADYVDRPQYFGATVGRFANRIAAGRFVVDGDSYRVPLNNGANSLHGGTVGFDKVVWDIVAVEQGAQAAVTLRHVSPDGDQGYPGTLTATATYTLHDDGALAIVYTAVTDAPTIVNITNHTYWNLASEGSAGGAMDTIVTIAADHFLPTDAGAIPTGAVQPVAGTPFDFRAPVAIGARVRAGDTQLMFGRGYDHNWVIGRAVTADEHLMARAVDPGSGRAFELWSTQPGLQFYSGNFLDGSSCGKAGRSYRMGDAFVMEPQLFPDTPNQPAFGSARLDPGQTYRNAMTYRFTCDGDRS